MQFQLFFCSVRFSVWFSWMFSDNQTQTVTWGITSMLMTDIGDHVVTNVTSPTSRVRHQHQISVIDITFWPIMMLVTDVSASENLLNLAPGWISCIQHHILTCRKMSPASFFVTNILNWSPSLSPQHHCHHLGLTRLPINLTS